MQRQKRMKKPSQIMKKMLAEKISNEETIYTKVTYSAYANVIGKLEKGNENSG